jgi:hypothetical protein
MVVVLDSHEIRRPGRLDEAWEPLFHHAHICISFPPGCHVRARGMCGGALPCGMQWRDRGRSGINNAPRRYVQRFPFRFLFLFSRMECLLRADGLITGAWCRARIRSPKDWFAGPAVSRGLTVGVGDEPDFPVISGMGSRTRNASLDLAGCCFWSQVA